MAPQAVGVHVAVAGVGGVAVIDPDPRIRGALQSGLPGQIIVRGEVSEWNRAPSGHRYFCLKDQRTTLACVMWQSDAAGLRFEPQVVVQAACSMHLDHVAMAIGARPEDVVRVGALGIDREHLSPDIANVGAGRMRVVLRRGRRVVLRAESSLAGLEHGTPLGA